MELMLTNNTRLANIKPKDMPFYSVNYDPFKQIPLWNEFLKSESYKNNLEKLVLEKN